MVKARVDAANLSHKDYANRELLHAPHEPASVHRLSQPGQLDRLHDGTVRAPGAATANRNHFYDLEWSYRSHPPHLDRGRRPAHRSEPAIPATGAADAVEQIAESPKAKACFDAAFIINTRYRPLDATDNCLMAELADIQSSNRPVIDALVQNVANEGIFWKSAKGVEWKQKHLLSRRMFLQGSGPALVSIPFLFSPGAIGASGTVGAATVRAHQFQLLSSAEPHLPALLEPLAEVPATSGSQSGLVAWTRRTPTPSFSP